MFQGTQSVKFLFYTNLLIFAITFVLAALNINILGPFVLWSYNSELFLPHQLITYQFLHGGFLHLIFNMLALVSILPAVEDYLDSKKFLIYYLICGIFAGLFNTFMTGSTIPMVGASGSIWGMVVMFAVLFPNTELLFMFIPIPIKAKWFVLGYGAFELFSGLKGSAGDNIAHFAHLGGMLFGFILLKYWQKQKNSFY